MSEGVEKGWCAEGNRRLLCPHDERSAGSKSEKHNARDRYGPGRHVTINAGPALRFGNHPPRGLPGSNPSSFGGANALAGCISVFP